jgi:hypothetical protein
VVRTRGGPPDAWLQELAARARGRAQRGGVDAGGSLTALVTVHGALFRAAALLSLVLGLWAIVTFVRRGELSPGFRSSAVLTEVLIVVQGLVGVGLFAGGARLKDPLHFVYGLVLTIALPVAAGYSSGQSGRRQALVFGITGIVMFLLTLRAWMTAGG